MDDSFSYVHVSANNTVVLFALLLAVPHATVYWAYTIDVDAVIQSFNLLDFPPHLNYSNLL